MRASPTARWTIGALALLGLAGVGLRAANSSCFAGPAQLQSCLRLDGPRGAYDPRSIQPGSIVFVGDSLTANGPWETLFPGVSLRNRGRSADETAGVLARIDSIAAARPGKIFMLIGTNDLHNGRSRSAIVTNIAATLRRIRTLSPTTRTYLQSVLPRSDGFADEILDLNRELQEVAVAERATWIDLHPAFTDAAGREIRRELARDGLHLSQRGYEIWHSLISPDIVDPVPGSVRLEVASLARITERLAAPRDRLRLLYVWASWCKPCAQELRFLVDLDRRTRGQPLEILTVSTDTPTHREAALEQLALLGATTQNYWLDATSPGEFAERFDPEWHGSVPYTAVLAPDGAWVFRKAGTFDPEDLEERVRGALQRLAP